MMETVWALEADGTVQIQALLRDTGQVIQSLCFLICKIGMMPFTLDRCLKKLNVNR